jgi:hypothetical protein
LSEKVFKSGFRRTQRFFEAGLSIPARLNQVVKNADYFLVLHLIPSFPNRSPSLWKLVKHVQK